MDVVDTVGAGDAFCAALVLALRGGHDEATALALALIGLCVLAVLASFPSEFSTWGVVWLLGAALALPRAPRVPSVPGRVNLLAIHGR